MSIEDEIKGYVESSVGTVGEIKKLLDYKIKALEGRDFNEAYRLAGVISLMAQKSEEVDRRMFVQAGWPEAPPDTYPGQEV